MIREAIFEGTGKKTDRFIMSLTGVNGIADMTNKIAALVPDAACGFCSWTDE